MRGFVVAIFIVLFFVIAIMGSAQQLVMSSNSSVTPQEDTNVLITKTVDGTNGYPRLIYEINVPLVDDFEFVLVLDSSGGVGVSGGPGEEQYNAVLNSVPNFISDISEKEIYKNKTFRVSIVSFDGDIDFAYGNFENRNPRDSKLVNVKNASPDMIHFKDFYKYDEKEFTNLSVGVGAAYDILNVSELTPRQYNRTKRFVILVVGDGEYQRCSEDLIRAVHDKNYSMYVIGMSVYDHTELHGHLAEIAGSSKNPRLQTIASDERDLNPQLYKALNDALQGATSEPVATNVTLSETFYSYIDPDSTSIKVNGELNEVIYINKVRNPDFTYGFSFELADGLPPESKTEITFDTMFYLPEIPISLTIPPKTTFIPNIANNTQPSSLSYRWFNGDLFYVPLKDAPTSIRTVQRPQSNGENRTLDGEFGIITLLILIFTLIIYRKGDIK